MLKGLFYKILLNPHIGYVFYLIIALHIMTNHYCYREKKKCTYGDKCTYAHLLEEMDVWNWMLANKSEPLYNCNSLGYDSEFIHFKCNKLLQLGDGTFLLILIILT
jgi:hypothetical protein